MAFTKQQFNALEELFNYYNNMLFGKELPACIVNFSESTSGNGFFIAERWKSKSEAPVHEICLNPNTMNRGNDKWHSTLVHEMVHLWEKVNGTESRYNYHNRKWAKKMEAIGLMPSKTGNPGGAKTGRPMSHYIIKGGEFEIAFRKIASDSLMRLTLPLTPNRFFGASNKRKIKYVCKCDTKVWGKAGLLISCMVCNKQLKPVK